jgi:hypothetical protein
MPGFQHGAVNKSMCIFGFPLQLRSKIEIEVASPTTNSKANWKTATKQ